MSWLKQSLEDASARVQSWPAWKRELEAAVSRSWRLLPLLFLLLCTSAQAQWKTRDVVLATSAVTFALLDVSTTLDAIHRCEPYGTERDCFHGSRECVEGNPLIGCFPSPLKFAAMSAAGIAGELFIGSRILHGWKRTAWFGGMTAVSFLLFRRNVNNGFNIRVTL